MSRPYIHVAIEPIRLVGWRLFDSQKLANPAEQRRDESTDESHFG